MRPHPEEEAEMVRRASLRFGEDEVDPLVELARLIGSEEPARPDQAEFARVMRKNGYTVTDPLSAQVLRYVPHPVRDAFFYRKKIKCFNVAQN